MLRRISQGSALPPNSLLRVGLSQLLDLLVQLKGPGPFE